MHTYLLSFDAACQALRQGQLIIFPTETFYGIGCDAFNADAIGKIFSVKQRDMSLPLPVVIGQREQLGGLVEFIPDLAERLIQEFWPGPLSLVLPAKKRVPDLLTASQGRLAVRLSGHPALRELCFAIDAPLVASSANISGTESVAALEQLAPDLLAQVAGVYNPPPAPEGIYSSTIADIVKCKQGECVRILRQGAISLAAIEEKGFPVLPPQVSST